MALQLPSWNLYEDWEKTGIGNVPALPRPKAQPVWFAPKPGAIVSYDKQMERRGA